MREFQQQKKRRYKISHWLFSPLVIVALAVMVVLLGNSVWNLYGKERDAATELASVEAQNQALLANKATLSQKIGHLQTPEGVDEAIRATYNVAKPGENMVVIMNSSTATSISSIGN